jgi:toxin HigB-1
MIAGFKSKALAELWAKSSAKGIDARMHARILRRLDVLNAATKAEDLNLPGFNFHALQGFDPPRYTVHVNGAWCVTFSFADGDAHEVDFEQYH